MITTEWFYIQITFICVSKNVILKRIHLGIWFWYCKAEKIWEQTNPILTSSFWERGSRLSQSNVSDYCQTDVTSQTTKLLMWHVNEHPTMHYFGNPRHTQSMIAYDFDWVFLEIPVKNCIMGMLLTCPIRQINTSNMVTSLSWSRLLYSVLTAFIWSSEDCNESLISESWARKLSFYNTKHHRIYKYVHIKQDGGSAPSNRMWQPNWLRLRRIFSVHWILLPNFPCFLNKK